MFYLFLWFYILFKCKQPIPYFAMRSSQVSRGLLMFAEGKALGPDGLFWWPGDEHVDGLLSGKLYNMAMNNHHF